MTVEQRAWCPVEERGTSERRFSLLLIDEKVTRRGEPVGKMPLRLSRWGLEPLFREGGGEPRT